MTSSYLLGPDLTEELTRLAAQAALSWPEEFRVLTELGLRDGHAVLDVGCGPGAFTRLLRDALPASPLIALDHDARLLAHARRVPRTLAVLGDLADPPVADASQDFVVSRFVFQHLPDPVAAAGRIRRVLRPGGLLTVIEVDAGLWGAAVPDMPQGYAEAYQAMAAEQGNGGGDRFIARRLPGLLTAAGYRDVLVRPYAYGGPVRDDAALATQVGPERLLPLVERGTLSLAGYAQAHAAWRRFVQCGGRVLLLGFVVSGRAPADGSPDCSLTDRLPNIFLAARWRRGIIGLNRSFEHDIVIQSSKLIGLERAVMHGTGSTNQARARWRGARLLAIFGSWAGLRRPGAGRRRGPGGRVR